MARKDFEILRGTLVSFDFAVGGITGRPRKVVGLDSVEELIVGWEMVVVVVLVVKIDRLVKRVAIVSR